jgi:GAF domain-containing protein
VNVDDAEMFARFAMLLHQQTSLEDTVERIVTFTVQAVGCGHAGVALATPGGGLEVGAVTSPVVATLYQAQIDAAHGPLIDALHHDETIVVCDTHTDPRWPVWAGHAAGLGVRAVVHVPLPADRPLGVLSLSSDKPDSFHPDDIAVAHLLARHATIALATTRNEANLEAAIDARKLIGQAQGILMERFDLDADQAFDVLRRYSQDYNIKLRVVAQRLISTRHLPNPTTRTRRRAEDTQH